MFTCCIKLMNTAININFYTFNKFVDTRYVIVRCNTGIIVYCIILIPILHGSTKESQTER